MREPSELLGAWSVESGGQHCGIQFGPARVETANAYRLEGAACLIPLLPRPAIGWRPAPDGIELVDADRLTIVLFVDDGTGTAVATLPAGARLTLRRG